MRSRSGPTARQIRSTWSAVRRPTSPAPADLIGNNVSRSRDFGKVFHSTPRAGHAVPPTGAAHEKPSVGIGEYTDRPSESPPATSQTHAQQELTHDRAGNDMD